MSLSTQWSHRDSYTYFNLAIIDWYRQLERNINSISLSSCPIKLNAGDANRKGSRARSFDSLVSQTIYGSIFVERTSFSRSFGISQ